VTLFDDAAVDKPRPAAPVAKVVHVVPSLDAHLVMVNDRGQPVTKVEQCWKWSRLVRGFGWHEGVPPEFARSAK
jgi:hypothetical protein